MTGLIPLKYTFDNEIIIFQYLDGDNVVYKNKKNRFIKESGLTISNPHPPIPAYMVRLSEEFGDRLLCGNVINNILILLAQNDVDGIILLIDFDGVLEVSQNFVDAYTKYLLETKNKVITTNQNNDVSNAFGEYTYDIFDIQNKERYHEFFKLRGELE